MYNPFSKSAAAMQPPFPSVFREETRTDEWEPEEGRPVPFRAGVWNCLVSRPTTKGKCAVKSSPPSTSSRRM